MQEQQPYHLTDIEEKLVGNAEWLILKRRIIDKVYQLFGQIHHQISVLPEIREFPFPDNCLENGAKISRGENYQDLPFVILDYPRLFSHTSVFAYRIMFWWGNYFSLTLHLSGEARRTYGRALSGHYHILRQGDFHIGTGNDEWAHHFVPENYRSLSQVEETEFKALISGHDFLKLSRQVPFDKWDSLEDIAAETLGIFLKAMTPSNTGHHRG